MPVMPTLHLKVKALGQDKMIQLVKNVLFVVEVILLLLKAVA